MNYKELKTVSLIQWSGSCDMYNSTFVKEKAKVGSKFIDEKFGVVTIKEIYTDKKRKIKYIVVTDIAGEDKIKRERYNGNFEVILLPSYFKEKQ